MSLVHGTGVDGATATGVNPVMIAGKDAAGNIDTLKVESGVASFSDAALAALIGEKQASPTANTLLARIKALETALAGTLDVTLSGSILAKDPATGNPVELTAVQDDNEDWVLRIVDAAPFAYDQTAESLKTISGMELYGKSTDIKPTTGVITGTSYYEIDTQDLYMWDGTAWVYQFSM